MKKDRSDAIQRLVGYVLRPLRLALPDREGYVVVQGTSQPDGFKDASRDGTRLASPCARGTRVLTIESHHITKLDICASPDNMPPLSSRHRRSSLSGTVTQMVTHHGPDMSVTALIHDEAMG